MSFPHKDNGCCKIVINGRFLGMKMTGVQRYAYEIVGALDKLAKQNQFEIAIPFDVKPNIILKNINIVRIGKLKNRFWEHFSLPLYVIRKNATLLNLCNIAPLLKPGIATIHDMKIFAHPEFFSKKFVLWYKFIFRNTIRRSNHILTVSEFSKKEIMRYYKINQKKIDVVPNAWQHIENTPYDANTITKNDLLKKQYFFSLSSLDPNKNFKWISNIALKNPTQKFVIAGGMNANVFSQKNGFSTPENLRFLGYVNDGEAKALMQNCKAFLFPSFYEGFGIPPLEAMSCGCPVVVSDIPVMHEIFGDSVHYINPNNSDVDLEEVLKRPV
jgi:glycosyltransferase involved in cell wall biosynthesis